MKKDNIPQFMQTHKQHIEDNGFSEKLAAQLSYYPQTRKPDIRKTAVALIVPCCSLLAVWLVSLLGGWQVFLEALMKSMASASPLIFAGYVLVGAILMSLLVLPVRLNTFN
jgi:hypothetical protein